MFAIYKKEMRNYFTTPLGYVFMAVFLAVSGFMFAFSTFQSQTSDISGYFQMMIFGYIVIVPVLTMRSFSEERRSRTEQLLLTAPVSITGMVFAKFLAAFTMFAGTVLLSCLYYLPLFNYSESGPNVAKALHVGHLRSAIIGESVKRIARFVGHEVIGDIHLGDWGQPMGLIIHELSLRYPDLPYFDESF